MLRHLQSPVVSLLSCLLVLAASGDDICMVRVVFPSALAGSGPLPLDDPNTDFVEVTGIGDAASFSGPRGKRRLAGLGATALRLPSAAPFIAPGGARASDPLVADAELISPLRC